MSFSTATHLLTSYDLSSREELIWAVVVACVFTALRWFGNQLMLNHMFVRQDKNLLTKEERLFEEIWLICFSSGLLAASWYVFLNNDSGASLANTHPLVRDWPRNAVSLDVLYLLRIEAGWYLHQVTRGWTASGVPLDRVMFYHHIGTLLIIRFCLWKNLLMVGVLTVSIFNISNPFLHLSKVAYVMDWRRARVVLFATFGLVFFVSRVLMLPMTIMKMGYIDAYKEDYQSFGEELLLLGNVMMLVLYALQIFWMAKIVRVLLRGRTGSTPRKSNKHETAFSDSRPLPNGKSKEN